MTSLAYLTPGSAQLADGRRSDRLTPGSARYAGVVLSRMILNSNNNNNENHSYCKRFSMAITVRIIIILIENESQ
jgi:hypothetical protein